MTGWVKQFENFNGIQPSEYFIGVIPARHKTVSVTVFLQGEFSVLDGREIGEHPVTGTATCCRSVFDRKCWVSERLLGRNWLYRCM